MVRTSPNPRIRRILALGRDVSQLSSGANLLTQAGYSTDLVVTVEQAVRRAGIGRYHLAIISYSFAHDEQLAIRTRLKQIKPSLPVLLLGPEHDNPETFLESVAAWLGKPKSPEIALHFNPEWSDEFAES